MSAKLMLFILATLQMNMLASELSPRRESRQTQRGLLLHAKAVGVGLKFDAREVVQPQLRLQEAAARGDQPSAKCRHW